VSFEKIRTTAASRQQPQVASAAAEVAEVAISGNK
jgi:hypothetical protein